LTYRLVVNFLYPGRLKDEIIDFNQHSVGYGIKILQNLKNPNPPATFNVDKQSISVTLTVLVIVLKV